jgi:hypothetical protein
MISHNKLDKSFGPVGSFSGIVVFIAGLGTLWFSLFSLILILIGAFIGFSYSGVEIDFDQRRVRFLNNFFGIIKSGQWVNVKPDMKIGIRKSNKAWRSYSGGNRILDVPSEDYRLLLFNASGEKLMPLKKFSDLTTTKKELELICKQLGIGKM